MTPDQFYRLETLVVFAMDRFAKALDRLDASHYPSAAPKAFLHQLRLEIGNRESAIEQILLDFVDDPEGASDRLCSEHRKLLARLTYLQAAENAKTDDVPWSLIPSIERLARALIPDRDIITTALSDFNYQIAIPRNEPTGIDKYLILFIPKIHRANSFLHLLIGHELFHPLLQPFLLEERKVVLPILRIGCFQLLLQAGEADNLFTRRRVDEIVQLASRYWQRAVEEIMCDFGCVAIFGPAAALSMSTFALTGGLDERPTAQGDFYPPMRYRLRSMLKYALGCEEGMACQQSLFKALDDSNFLEDSARLKERMSSISALASASDDITEIETDPIARLAYKSVDSSLHKAWDYVYKISCPLDDRWTATYSQVPSLLRSLELLVPPSEVRDDKAKIGQPSAWSAIALACWVFQLRSEVPASMAEHLRSFKRLCRLMLKACEDSELKRQFTSWKIEGG